MSDDPPPDLIDTAEFPLDELFRKENKDHGNGRASLGPADAESLFSDARPLGLGGPGSNPQSGTEPDGSILEGSERTFSDRLLPTASINRVRMFLASGRDHAGPIYRRQGTLALLGLCALAGIVAVSFPRTRATLGSNVEVRTDVIEPAAPLGSAEGSKHDNVVDAAGSDGLFGGSKTEQALGQAAAGADGENDRSTTDTTDGQSEQLPTLSELLETSVVVGPEPAGCDGSGGQPPDCVSSTTSDPEQAILIDTSTTSAPPPTEPSTSETADPTTTVAPATTTSTSEPATTTTRRTTTTGRATTSTRRTTTTRRTTSTTARSTTTRRATTTTALTTSTVRATTTTSGGTTTTESATTTTTGPDETSPDTTEPGGPTESSGPGNTVVICTPDDTTPGETIPRSEPGLPVPIPEPCPDPVTTTTRPGSGG